MFCSHLFVCWCSYYEGRLVSGLSAGTLTDLQLINLLQRQTHIINNTIDIPSQDYYYYYY